jgi:hypothetical protein
MRGGAACGLVLGIVAGAAAWADIDMQPGLWEDETMGSSGAPHTERKCFLARDIANTDKFQHGRIPDPEGRCTASAYEGDGRHVAYTVTCKAGSASAQTRYIASYFGDHAMVSVIDDFSIKTITRRRIGDCDKSSFGP